MFACVHASGVFDRGSLVELASGFSPRVEETSDDTVVLDITGCELLFGPPRNVACSIARRASDFGIAANVAVAQNPDAALLAAKNLKGITIIPTGRELKCLGDLRVRALLDDALICRAAILAQRVIRRGPQCGGEGVAAEQEGRMAGDRVQDRALEIQKEELQKLALIIDTLELWGVYTLGDFAALPEAGVSERLGPEGVRLQKLARGEGDRPLLLAGPEPGFERSIELDDPVELIEPLSFILAHLINQLCADLKTHALAANELRLRFKLEDRTETERLLRLPFPMRDQKTFLRLLLLDVESHPPQAPVVAASLACEPAEPRAIQNGLFHPLAPEPEKLELTIARIARLVGAENVGSPEILDTHRPDAFRIKRFGVMKRFTLETRRQREGRSRSGKPNARSGDNPKSKIGNPKFILGFRVFRPPLAARVESPKGWPTRISAQSRDRSIRGKVVRAAGPWRTSGDWWMADGWARDEWDIAIGISDAQEERQLVCRIYRDLRSDTWFVEGTYD